MKFGRMGNIQIWGIGWHYKTKINNQTLTKRDSLSPVARQQTKSKVINNLDKISQKEGSEGIINNC